MTLEEFRKIRPTLPQQPGVYKFLDHRQKPLYIGKAKNLRNRLSSYFNKGKYVNSRILLLRKKTANIEFIIVNSEHDAFLLENSLIKKHQPRYNIQLKDDKSYPYICIKKERFPRVFLSRNIIQDGSEYLGPFTSVIRVKTLLQLSKTLFPLRNCNFNLSASNIAQRKFKLCLEYHLGNCLGPCENRQTEEDYNNSVAQIRNILRGNISLVMNYLKEKMQKYADAYEFEIANEMKEKLNMLSSYKLRNTVINPKLGMLDVFGLVDGEQRAFVNYLKVTDGAVVVSQTLEIRKSLAESPEEMLEQVIPYFRQQHQSQAQEIIAQYPVNLYDESLHLTIPKIGDKKKLLDLSLKNAHFRKKQLTLKATKYKIADKKITILQQLQEDLNLKDLPLHIECFDNSNFQGQEPVASVVVFKNGKPSNSDYRHFNIKTVHGPNDFASMKEIVFRRYNKFLKEKLDLPQLIIIDGGKGQLSAACHALEELNVMGKTAIISIAKKLEEIYFPHDSVPLYINKKSSSLRLIQQIRNEAHRFAITFHRKKSLMKLSNSSLTNIKGIGNLTVEKLLRKFKSVKKLKLASFDEIAAVVGKAKAQILYDQLINNSNP